MPHDHRARVSAGVHVRNVAGLSHTTFSAFIFPRRDSRAAARPAAMKRAACAIDGGGRACRSGRVPCGATSPFRRVTSGARSTSVCAMSTKVRCQPSARLAACPAETYGGVGGGDGWSDRLRVAPDPRSTWPAVTGTSVRSTSLALARTGARRGRVHGARSENFRRTFVR